MVVSKSCSLMHTSILFVKVLTIAGRLLASLNKNQKVEKEELGGIVRML